MITVRRVQPGDIEKIAVEAAEEWVRELAGTGALDPLSAEGTLVCEIDGEPASAGGYVDVGNGSALGWAMVRKIPPQFFVRLCRIYRTHLRAAPFHRIEAHCREGLVQQFRWVRCLGFEPLDAEPLVMNGKKFLRFVFRG